MRRNIIITINKENLASSLQEYSSNIFISGIKKMKININNLQTQASGENLVEVPDVSQNRPVTPYDYFVSLPALITALTALVAALTPLILGLKNKCKKQ